jgi:acyl-CoA thioesterase FadM
MFRLIDVLRRKDAPPTHGLLDEVTQEFRVGLTDIDLNLHLNNAKYLKYMDLARLEHMLCTGLLGRYLRGRTNAVIANTEISYIRELRTWQRFTVSARIAGWDDKYLYFEQRFHADGRLCTHAFIRLAHLHRRKSIPVAEAFARCGIEGTSPPLPLPVQRWKEMLAAKRDYARGVGGETTQQPGEQRHVA